jgi:hypothetical protein
MTDTVGKGSGSDANQNGNPKQSSANPETEMPQWAVDLNAKVDEALGQARAAQSGKDQLQHQLDEAQSTFESAFEYAKKFEDPVEAERAWYVDQQIAQSRANQGGQENLSQQNDQSLAGQSSDAVTVDTELLKSMGVDPQSAEYLEQVRLGKVGYEAAMNVLAARQTQAGEGDATGASGGAGGSTTSTTTQQQVLLDQYHTELDEAAALTHGVLKPQALFQIQSKYAKLGLVSVQ